MWRPPQRTSIPSARASGIQSTPTSRMRARRACPTSSCTAQDHEKRATLVKELAAKVGRTVAILCDLQGPKIRVGKFKDGKVTLEKGQSFVLDAGLEMGDGSRSGLDYKELPRDVAQGAV